MKSKISYRVWQFWQSFKFSPSDEDWEKVNQILAPLELNLFRRLPIPDQNHSLRVLGSLQNQGENVPGLLKAALLHDVGKSKFPLKRWERVFAVLVRGFFPRRAAVWGSGDPKGFFRPLIVIQQHSLWGADLAANAGCSDQVIWLIKNHELDQISGEQNHPDVELLKKLQAADNRN
ncbi:MAG: HD domain-containing protein [Chloroflexi bacterium]|nr:HD domain-containing protein [Chloroflexota bacterium]